MIKTMILEQHYILCILFVLLLTIVLFGIGRVVVKMTFGKVSEDKDKVVDKNRKKLSVFMYIPQFIMLIIVFVLGVYVPPFLNNIINCAVAGF